MYEFSHGTKHALKAKFDLDFPSSPPPPFIASNWAGLMQTQTCFSEFLQKLISNSFMSH